MRDLKSRNRPQREGFSCFQAGISVVKKVELTVEASTRKRYLFSESQGVERTQIFLEFDLNEHSVLAALLIDCKNSCGNWSHFASLSTSDFAGDEIRL
jgi:hypothetical protein